MNDRPLECSNCKKPATIIYKEMELNGIVETRMCAECPVLQMKLEGTKKADIQTKCSKEISCENCGTTHESVQTGEPLGCSECYNAFEKLITEELRVADKIGAKASPSIEKSLHIGKSPVQPQDVTLSNRLQELNQELNDALKRENYEQAAWLRDQIKEIMEGAHE